MTLLADLLIFLVQTIDFLISIYIFIVIAACLLSFVNPDPYNSVVRFIRRLTEPAFYAIRRYLPFVVIAGLDLSPLVLIFGLRLLSSVFFTAILRFAFSLKMGV